MQTGPIGEDRIREAYIQGVLAELTEETRERAEMRARVITRTMKPAEKEAYLNSQSFRNTLNQTRRRDKTWQAFSRGEVPEAYLPEMESLRSLMEQELAAGRTIDLRFLRSVRHIRQSLRTARRAVDCLEKKLPETWVRRNAERIAGELDAITAGWLRSADLSAMTVHPGKQGGSAAEALMRSLFRKGIPLRVADAALREGRLTFFLEGKAREAYPVLKACGKLRMPEGGTAESRLREQIQNGQGEVLEALKAHFPSKRIWKLLLQNPSLQRAEKHREQQRADRRNLREALLKVMPAEVRDLYPLARKIHRHFILHLGPTNSGKTFESIQRLHGARHGIYLGPLRLLAFEQFETLNLEDVPCSLVTGEERIPVPDSRVQASTIEMADLHETYDVAVIDEAQMISDPDRGGAWSAAVLGLCAGEIHVCASPDAERLLVTIIQDCGDEVSIVRHERMAPLLVEEGGFHFPSGVRRGDALIVFSSARVHALAAELKQLGYSVSLIYGALPPDVRRNQAERFRRGETDIVVSTDAIAMGMNLPIARIVFMESEKYDGDITRPLSDSEIRQIAGRAGRFGQYDVGYVNALGFRTEVAQALQRPALPLTHALIRFPESLLGLPLPLTEIIDRWISMGDRGCFSKASTVRMASLAGMMQTPRTDKRLLYDFICIPFDETDPDLMAEWKAMYHAEASDTHYDVWERLPEWINPEECTVRMLDRLEEDYRLCDLYYNYTRRFLEEPEKLLETIQQRKDLISSGIIHVLSTQKLQGRTCRKCGRRLAWDWPDSQCEACYRSGRSGRERT